jgi:hypothetical protein
VKLAGVHVALRRMLMLRMTALPSSNVLRSSLVLSSSRP